MFFGWLHRRRRRQLLARPLALAETDVLRRQVWHYPYLPSTQRERVDQIVRVFTAEKEWVGAGVELNDAMRLTIAGYAAVLVSGFPEPFFYDQLHTVIVRPRWFRYAAEDESPDNPYLTSETRIGEAWHRGPVVLSWNAVLRAARSPQNVALHEFAHHLDGLYGAMDGAPALGDRRSAKKWYDVTEAEFLRLVGKAQRAEATLLDHYGATNRAEFFAVATECFFQRPHAMRRRHAELYATLADFYQQEPHAWMPPAASERPLPEPVAQRASQGPRRRPGPPRLDAPEQRERRARAYEALEAPDALFSLALERLDDGDLSDALRILSILLESHPDDEEALAHRAIALRGLGRDDEALADCERALDIDPQDVDALAIRGAIRRDRGDVRGALADLDAAVSCAPRDAAARFERAVALWDAGDIKAAIRDLNEVLAVEPYDADAYYLRGRAYERLGRGRRAANDLERARLLDPHVARRFAD
jgi:Mlc titration factor MtfA (ptsG expression regulator)/Tfp pilus assembly protein PilF